MEKKKVLVVTPTLGTRSSLWRTIQSVRLYGGSMVKHVVVCPYEKKSYISKTYNVDCIAEPIGCKGVFAAVNYVFYLLGKQYEYITYINDDDYWLPDFSVLLEFIEHTKVDLVYAKVVYERNGHRRCMACSDRFYDFVPLLKGGIVLFTQQATLLRSSIFFSVGGFDETYRLVADTKLWAFLSLQNISYFYVEKVCAVYTYQEGQLSSDKELQKHEHILLNVQLPNYALYKVLLATIRFRIQNMFVYMKRIGHLRHCLSYCKKIK